METGGPSAIVIALWFLAANAILILTAYGLIVLWRKKSQAAISLVGERIQGFDEALAQIGDFLQGFAGVNQEPYAEPLNKLQTEAVTLQEQLQGFLESSQAYETEIHTVRITGLQDIINAPANWFRRWRGSAALQKECDAFAGQLGNANEHMQKIVNLPWDLAQQCRQADEDLAELIRTAQALQAGGARGSALQTILTQIPQLQRAMDGIPPEFFDAGQEQLLAAIQVDAVIRVFEILNRIRPALHRYLPTVREWNTHHQKASTEYSELKQAGADLRQAIAQAPSGLIVSTMQARLDQIAQLASDLNQRLTQPEAEGLKSLSREIAQLHKVIQDTEQQYKRACQQLKELGANIEELTGGLNSLATRLTQLERSPFFPLVWDTSGPLLADLRQRLQALGSVQQPHTPEQISQQLKETENIQSAYQSLNESTPKVMEQHRVLVALLESPDLSTGAEWLHNAQLMLDKAAVYDPHNWSKQDAIQLLPTELEELTLKHQQLVPVDQASQLKEAELAHRLRETQHLAALHKALRPRLENVRLRLEKIQALETEGKEQLNAAYNVLDRAALLSESNDLLYEIAGQEMERMIDEVRVLGNELGTQSQGEIEKKLQKIHALTEKVNRSMNEWLARQNAAIQEQGKRMNDQLAELDATGQLSDTPVTEARSLLTRDEYLSATRAPAPQITPSGGGLRERLTQVSAGLQRQPQLTALEAFAELKRKNDFWQTLLAAQKALEESTRALLAAYQETVQARTEAHEQLAEAAKRISDHRSWPPSNQSPLTEAQALQPLLEKWEAQKKQARPGDEVVLELGSLTQQYRLVSERASQLISRVDQDEGRVRDQENEINDLKQRWQAQLQNDPNNPVIQEGIQHLLKQAESQSAYIKSQYMLGKISYEQVIHNLQLLSDELYTARVPVDDKSDIGLNEPHQRRMEQT